MFCAVSGSKFMSLFFGERTVTRVIYLDMLQQWLMPQLKEKKAYFILQQYGVSAHFFEIVRNYLNAELPGR